MYNLKRQLNQKCKVCNILDGQNHFLKYNCFHKNQDLIVDDINNFEKIMIMS